LIYEYDCPKCQEIVEVVKSMHDAARVEHCIICDNVMERLWNAPQIIGAKVEEAEFNHGLGCVTKSKNHRNEIAKRKGLIEVGTTKTDTIHKESEYTLKKKLSWEGI